LSKAWVVRGRTITENELGEIEAAAPPVRPKDRARVFTANTMASGARQSDMSLRQERARPQSTPPPPPPSRRYALRVGRAVRERSSRPEAAADMTKAAFENRDRGS